MPSFSQQRLQVNTSSFDTIIERVFEATGIDSQTELARVLKINRSAVTQARKKGQVPDRWLLQLYRKFGLNPEWLESGAGRIFLTAAGESVTQFERIPKVAARLCAGDGSFETDADVQAYHAFQKDWLRRKGKPGAMVLFDIFGNSMEPELKNGDTVLIDQSQQAILAGAMYAVGIEDTIMVKRIEKRPNKLVLLSNHKDYLPVTLNEHPCTETRRAAVALVLDTSSSMRERTASGVTKVEAAKEAAALFIDLLNFPEDQVAIVGFDSAARLARELTSDPDALKLSLAGLTTGYGTDIAAGLAAAHAELTSQRRRADNDALRAIGVAEVCSACDQILARTVTPVLAVNAVRPDRYAPDHHCCQTS